MDIAGAFVGAATEQVSIKPVLLGLQGLSWSCTNTPDATFSLLQHRQQNSRCFCTGFANNTTHKATYSLHLLQHSVFDFDVFKNSFDDHVGFFEAAVVQVARQVGQDGVSLKRCDVLLFGFVIEPGYK